MVPGVLRTAAVWVVVLVVVRVAVVPPERCQVPDRSEVVAAVAAAHRWLEVNARPDGTFLYVHDGEAAVTGAGYSIVRHAGVLMSMYQVAALTGGEVSPAAEAGLAWAEDRLVPAGGGVAVADASGRLDTGAAALLAAALTYRRDATGDTDRDDLLRALGRFMVGQVTAEGAVSSRFDPATGAPVPGERSPFATGEASWALARMDGRVGGGPWGETARRILGYVATDRDEVEPEFPPNDDHWSAYTLSEIEPAALDGAEVAYARRLAALWSPEVRFDAQRTGRGVNRLVRGPTNRGGQQGTNTEGLAALWRLSRSDPRLGHLTGRLGGLVGCTAGMLVDRQVTASEAAAAPDPAALTGAWFRDGETRMDTQQHVMSGLLAAVEVIEAGAAGAPGPRPGVDVGLLAAAVVAVAVVMAGERRVRGPGSGRGAVATAVVLGAAIVVASPLLRWLDVHPVSARLAAAVAVLGVAGLRLLRRGRTGRPVAVPLLADPVLALVVLWAAADLGRWEAATAVVAGGALAVVAARVDLAPRATHPIATAAAAAVGVHLFLAGVVGI